MPKSAIVEGIPNTHTGAWAGLPSLSLLRADSSVSSKSLPIAAKEWAMWISI